MQEVDLQRYRTRLVSLGKLQDAAGANLRPRREQSFQESIRAFEGECAAEELLGSTGSHVPNKGQCHRVAQLQHYAAAACSCITQSLKLGGLCTSTLTLPDQPVRPALS